MNNYEELVTKCHQLEEERDAARLTAKEFLNAARKLKKERDAAIEEIPHYCQNCKNSYLNNPTKAACKYAEICGKKETFWEWRGLHE